jgi:uncharacterized protein (TIRG00374 family)
MARVGRASVLLLGIALLIVVLTQIDLGTAALHLREMGWTFPLMFLPYVAVYLCDALGWKFAFARSPSVPFHSLFMTRMAGEAINNLTPFAYMGGEPVKAHLLTRFQIPMVEGMAATIIAKLTMTMAQFVFVVLGGILAASYLMGRPDILWALGVVVTGAAALLVGVSRALQIGVFAPLYGLLRRWKLGLPFLERRRQRLRRLDHTIATFYRHHPGRLLWSLTCYLVGWLLGGLEVLMIFYAIGLPIGLPQALAIEALASVAKGLAFFIPGSLGAQEGGNVLILGAFGFAGGLGITFSLLRRVRELIWISVGLVVLLRYYGWSWRPG